MTSRGPAGPSASLLVTTYNWPEALAAILASVERQRVLPAEVIVADDGSGEPTRRLVAERARAFPVPLVHVWQPDEGFRAGQARNRGVAAATGEYVLQIDGDMVLHPDFVGDHVAAARRGRFVAGSRAILSPEATARVLAGEIPGLSTRGLRHRLNALRVPALSPAASRLAARGGLLRIRGCNFAFWRDDFLAVNGYDEAYVGWGREDTDLVVRLLRLGLGRTHLKLAAVAYHLHHREASRDALARNDALLEEALASRPARCERGVAQWIGAPVRSGP